MIRIRRPSQALPAMSELNSTGQKCQYLEVTDRQNANGRIMMTEVFGARMLDRKLLIQQPLKAFVKPFGGKMFDSHSERIKLLQLFDSQDFDHLNFTILLLGPFRSAWGGYRQDYQSCGFNHEPMQQAGGCTSRAAKQKVSFLVTVKSPRDLYLFIGPKNGIGYEVRSVEFCFYLWLVLLEPKTRR